MSFLKPDTPNVPAPVAPTPTPPVMAPQGAKPAPKRQQASFLGAAASANPAMQSGGQTGKTLLGQ